LNLSASVFTLLVVLPLLLSTLNARLPQQRSREDRCASPQHASVSFK
jgi:hypothetical protein